MIIEPNNGGKNMDTSNKNTDKLPKLKSIYASNSGFLRFLLVICNISLYKAGVIS